MGHAVRSSFKTKAGTELPILNLRGKEYLQVAHRLVWFREEHPDWTIQTELVSVTDKSATAKATILDSQGRIIATAHKFENEQGFPDFIEKAETGSVGRALALCGYGTQFVADELDEGKRLADSPIAAARGGVHPGEPGPEDCPNSIPSSHYVISFGGWNKKTLEEIYADPAIGPNKMASRIAWYEDQARKSGKPLSPQAKELCDRISEFLGAMENSFDPNSPSSMQNGAGGR